MRKQYKLLLENSLVVILLTKLMTAIHKQRTKYLMRANAGTQASMKTDYTVMIKLIQLKEDKAPGPDDVHPNY